MLASLERQLCFCLAAGAFHPEDDFLRCLGFLVEDGFRLTAVTGLFAVVSALSLREGRGLFCCVSDVGRWCRILGGRALPALYCVTLWFVCFLQSLPLQYVRRVFGTLTWRVLV